MKKPNFDFERREREKAKAAKKAEKAAAKASRGQEPRDADDEGAGERASDRASAE